MSVSKNFIPRPDAVFNEWQGTLVNYVRVKLPVWNVPQEDFTALTTLQTDFSAKYAKAENPETRTPAAVTAKIEARNAYEKGMRTFVKEHLTNNHRVTDEDRRNMQLPIHDTKPTPVDPPKSMVLGRIDFSVHQQHTVHVEDSAGKGRPDNAHGFEAWRKTGGEPPTSDDDFRYAGFSPSTTLTLDYPLADVGKTVYYRFRWVNRRNQPGPWSEAVISAVIA
jgi:hypothetical protein